MTQPNPIPSNNDPTVQATDNSAPVSTDSNLQIMGANSVSSSNSNTGSNAPVKSLDQLKQQNPVLYNTMMVGIAMNMIIDNENFQKKMDEILKEERQNEEDNSQ